MDVVSRREVLAAGAVTVLSATAGCELPSGSDGADADGSVPRTVTTPPPSGAGEPGWLLVRGSDPIEFVFDLRICGRVGDVYVAEAPGENARELRIEASLDDPDQCSLSRLVGSFEVDTAGVTLDVTVDGRTIATIERADVTTTSLRELPDRVSRATDGR